jgi:5-formyltetrahydrofolate cyclo-ligase
MTDKKLLRASLRAARAAMPRAPIPVASEFTARLTPHTIVATYVAIGGEADPTLFARAAHAAGCRLALPHVESREEPIRFLAWHPDAPLARGPFALRQPHAHKPELAPDIVLTPLVGFDRRGNRVGQGAGHYDRAFAAYPAAWRVGIAWSVQEVSALTPDPWDVPLHAIATEKEWIMPVSPPS